MMMNKKKPFSLHLDVDSFMPATAEEKEVISRMRPSSTFFRDGVKRLLKNKVATISLILNIVLCMICMSLKQDERAEQKFDAAWSIASREGYIHPFVEHHGILQGQVERALRKQDPETYNKIVQSVYRFSRGWMKIHNPVSTLQVTDALTPYEFSIAMLAAKGRSNKEIAALMGVSVNTVKSYMESIFEKLQISSRNEIDAYVNR